MARTAFVLNDAVREKCGTWPVSIPSGRHRQDRRLRPKDDAQALRKELDRGCSPPRRRAYHGDHLLAEDQSVIGASGRRRAAIANADAGSNSEVVLVLRDHNRDLALTPVLQDVQQKYLRRETPQAAALDLRHRGYEPLSC